MLLTAELEKQFVIGVAINPLTEKRIVLVH